MSSPSATDEYPTAAQAAETYADSIKDKVILVTGVSPGGLGAEFVIAIAPYKPKLIILAGRDETKVQATQESIKQFDCQTRTLILSLDAQQDVRQAADRVLAYDDVPIIDTLVNNAGIMAGPFRPAPDGQGLELQFATNYIGPWLFTNLIMPKILASHAPRIVNVTSSGYRFSPIRFIDLGFDNGSAYDQWRAYGQSKTANMLFTRSLAAKLGKKSNLVVFAPHPGTIQTNLGKSINEKDFEELTAIGKAIGKDPSSKGGLQFIPLEKGATALIFSAFDEKDVPNHNGGHSDKSTILQPEQIHCWGRDDVDAQHLWRITEKIGGQEFTW